MSKKRTTDDRKQLLIRYKIDEKDVCLLLIPVVMKFQLIFLVRLWKLYRM